MRFLYALVVAALILSELDDWHWRHEYALATGSHVMVAKFNGRRVPFIGNSQDAWRVVPLYTPYRVAFATHSEAEEFISQHGTEGRWVKIDN